MGVLLVGMAKRTIPEKPGFRESCMNGQPRLFADQMIGGISGGDDQQHDAIHQKYTHGLKPPLGGI